jgi:hypothetical protein
MQVSLTRRSSTRVLGGALVATMVIAGLALPARAAAGPVKVDSFTVTVTPKRVTAQVMLHTDRPRTISQFVIAVRDSRGRNVDFPLQNRFQLSEAPRSWKQSTTLRNGTYTAWVAYNLDGRWVDLAPRRTFTVGTKTPTTVGPAAPAEPVTRPTAPRPAPRPVPTTSPISPISPTSAPPSNTASAPPATGDWQLAFSDEFNGTAVDWQKWADTSSAENDNGRGNKGNQQLEWNQGKNCTVAGGTLVQLAKPDDITSPSGQHYEWSSCLLSSSPSFAFQYGYIEIRSKLPSAKGFWPAFWTWQAAGNNTWTETDVYEFYSDNHNRLYLSQHSGSGGGCQLSPTFDPTTAFHTYGADIKSTGTDFYIDNKLVCSAAGSPSGKTNLIIDNFVYSKIPPAAGSTGKHEIDWVRAWTRK